MCPPHWRRSVCFTFVLILPLLTAGCAGLSDDVTETEPSEEPTGYDLSFRLKITPVEDSTVTTHVTIRNQSNDNRTVFEEHLTLDGEIDLSDQFDATSTYVVALETGDNRSVYMIPDYSGYNIHLNKSGAVRVEAIMI